jgi:hypothetical protein
MPEPDYTECMRVLTEDYLPNITVGLDPGDPIVMRDTLYQVNRLRRASKDALYALLELEQSVTK